MVRNKMDYNKGIIMKIEKDYAIVMCTSGSFVRVVLKDNMTIGQKIFFFQDDIYEKKSNIISFNKNIKSYFSIAAAFLIFFIGQFTINNFIVDTYIGIDINPSLELGLNKYSKVISVNSLNNDGENIIENRKLKGLSINNAINEIIDVSKELNYINNENHSVFLTIETKGKEKEGLEKTLEIVKEENKDIEFNLVKVEVIKNKSKSYKREVIKEEEEQNNKSTNNSTHSKSVDRDTSDLIDNKDKETFNQNELVNNKNLGKEDINEDNENDKTFDNSSSDNSADISDAKEEDYKDEDYNSESIDDDEGDYESDEEELDNESDEDDDLDDDEDLDDDDLDNDDINESHDEELDNEDEEIDNNEEFEFDDEDEGDIDNNKEDFDDDSDYDKDENSIEEILNDNDSYSSRWVEEKDDFEEVEENEEDEKIIREIEKEVVIEDDIASTSNPIISQTHMDELLEEGYFDNEGKYIKYEDIDKEVEEVEEDKEEKMSWWDKFINGGSKTSSSRSKSSSDDDEDSYSNNNYSSNEDDKDDNDYDNDRDDNDDNDRDDDEDNDED